MDACAREARGTIGCFAAYLLMAHTAPWVILFGVDNSIRVFGFPLHYFLAIVAGWFGVLGVSILWNRWADRLEAEIAAEDGAGAPPFPDVERVAVPGGDPAAVPGAGRSAGEERPS